MRREPFRPFLNKRTRLRIRPSFVIVPSSFCFCCTSRTRRAPVHVHPPPQSFSVPHFTFSAGAGGDYSCATSRRLPLSYSENDTEIATSTGSYFCFSLLIFRLSVALLASSSSSSSLLSSSFSSFSSRIVSLDLKRIFTSDG